jgi:hypothetical protein
MSLLISIFLAAWPLPSAFAASKVRNVSSSSCNATHVNVALGITTQIIFEQEPKVTLYADKKHFKVVTNASSPRSLAIIPVVENSEMDIFRNGKGGLPSPAALAAALDRSFKTNLFVFFDNNNQLMFELHFVDKPKADYILKVTQVFTERCEL